ncbi:hypothetical protein HanRHA438_Chr04g0177431 [Helianthus annuus]|nr:hypothetical protein HanRHA438_Chr04g0177431 [Helianthus annuus]
MENNSNLGIDWNAYVIASGGYIKSGLLDKAFEMLRTSEEFIHGNSKGAAWENLISTYASIGKKTYALYDTHCFTVQSSIRSDFNL